MAASKAVHSRSGSGSFTTAAAFVIGLPAGIGALWVLTQGPLHNEMTTRYLHHPVEMVEVVMFFCALGVLAAKLVLSVRERLGLRSEIIPAWDGKAVAPSEAGRLLQSHDETIRHWGGTLIGRRIAAVLDFVKSRGSANELDDQVRSLADADAMAQDSSYALVRFITWAIPILGFLGTVLGITAAIASVTPEKLDKEMHLVTGGLSLAFDATALGLGLTMILMFLTFLVERVEQAVLEQVDAVVETDLGHRFLRTTADHAPLLLAIETNSRHMVDAAENLVRRQADVWAQSLGQVTKVGQEGAAVQQKKLVGGLEQALETTLTRHGQRLAELESQIVQRHQHMLTSISQLVEVLKSTSQQHQTGLTDISQRIAQQTTALVRLQESGAELSRLQEVLSQNLTSLAGAGAFEQAVQSLTAAIHLLTTKVSPVASPKKVA